MSKAANPSQLLTALSKYDRLECTGLWREGQEARLREVVVGLRAATLVLSDAKTEMALAQWSLPALRRVNPAKLPALYAPSADDDEMLEIDDPEMIAALDTVSRTLDHRRAKPGRLRASLYAGTTLVLLGMTVFWLPPRLVNYTAAMLPLPTRADLGDMALRDLARLTGAPCSSPFGDAALEALAQRLDPDNPPRIKILRAGATSPTTLPGGLVLLPSSLLEQSEGPDAIAGFILAAKGRAMSGDPTKSLLRYAGLWATIKLLTSGEMSAQSLEGYGDTLLQAGAPAISDLELISAFKSAGVSIAPFAKMQMPIPQSLIDADPMPNGSVPPTLEDGVWLGLQAICQ